MIATREEVIASILNQPNMQTINWQALMLHGVFVKLHIGRTRFEKKLLPLDIGIVAPTKELQKRLHRSYSLGSLRFLPEKYREDLDSVENRARQSLEAYGMRVPGIGCFIPVTAYLTWRKVVDDLEKEYYALQEDLLTNYEKAKNEAVSYHLRTSNLVYQIYETTAKQYLPPEDRADRATFRANIRERMLKLFPSRKKIEDSFFFEVEEAYSNLPSLMKEEEFPLADMEITPEMLEDEMWQIQRQKMLQQMNRRVVADAQKVRQQKIDEFLDGVLGAARQIIYEKCLVILGAIQQKGTVSGRATDSIGSMIKAISELNFYGDRELKQVMDSMEALIQGYSTTKDKRTVSVAQIQQVLQNITIVTRSTLLSLKVEDREAREDPSEEITAQKQKYEELRVKAGIPEEPTIAQQRQAREMLKMDIPAYLGNEDRGQRERVPVDRSERAF